MTIVEAKMLVFTTLGFLLIGSGMARLVLRKASPGAAAWRIVVGVGVAMSGVGAPGGVPGALGAALGTAGPVIAVAALLGEYRSNLAIKEAERERLSRP